MTKSAKWYRVLTSAEDMLILNYTEIPIYALRLLLYLHDADQNIRTITSADIKKDFNFNGPKLSRVVTQHLQVYIDIHHIFVDGVKKPVYRYTLSRKGTQYIETLLNQIDNL